MAVLRTNAEGSLAAVRACEHFAEVRRLDREAALRETDLEARRLLVELCELPRPVTRVE